MFHDPVENMYGIIATNLFPRHDNVYFHYRTGDYFHYRTALPQGQGSICFWRVDYCAVFVSERSCIEALSELKGYTHCLEQRHSTIGSATVS